MDTTTNAFDRLRKEAKSLLKDLRHGDAAAVRRYACYWPAAEVGDQLCLARAQLVVAREHGYRSWSHLKTSLVPREGEETMDLDASGFLQKLVALLDAGQPLIRSLHEMGSSEELAPALRPIVHQLAEDVSAGSSFSDALAKHPTVFDPGYMAMLKLFEDEMRKAGGPVNEAPAP
jgi:hypothetical protein